VRVIVITGSREWPFREPLELVMAGAELAILGDAEGADTIALEIAILNDIIPVVYCASPRRAMDLRERYGSAVSVHIASDWDKDGRYGPNNAGHLRNHAMRRRAVAERAADMDVECFAAPLPGSVGTHHCSRILRAEGFRVQTIRAPQRVGS
jgi:hypothetical protein